MARLIDANEAKAFAAECWPKPEYRIAIDALLDNCPTIDPVHAAGACYCRECKHWQEHYDYCKEFAAERNQGDFCSCGEKRNVDENTHSSV